MTRIINERSVFFFLLTLSFAFVWMMPVYLTQDGPTSLYNAKIFRDMITNNNAEFYSPYFKLNFNLFPNWFTTVFLALLIGVFKPIIAEKVFISLLVVAFPLSFRYALKKINPSAVYLSSFIFVLSNGYFLLFGFYNFLWSVVFFCLFIGAYYGDKGDRKPKRLLWLSTLCILLFFMHPVALVILYILMAVDFISEWIREGFNFKNFGNYAVIIIPSLILMVLYSIHATNEDPVFDFKLFSLHWWAYLLLPLTFKVFSAYEYIVYSLFSLLLFINCAYIALNWKKIPIPGTVKPLMVVIGILLFMYFFLSDYFAGGGYIIIRISLYIYLFLIFCLASFEISDTFRKITVTVCFIMSFSLLLVRFPVQYRMGRLVSNYIDEVEKLPANVVVLPMGFSDLGEIGNQVLCPGLELFGGISPYLGTSVQRICLSNYQADQTYFPIKYQFDANPFTHLCVKLGNGLSGVGANPPSIDLSSYINGKHIPVDYIILWGDPSRFKGTKEMEAFSQQLRNEHFYLHSNRDSLIWIYAPL